ncbi:DUF4232 domain-containing protein [Kitasatospora sp. NPDC088134]|uniref:DUF4232 domain-containing protein n=1 Tax=Kitasatospora sp. NPDC088134 TaxID=3364071 RepID=UPI0037F1ADCC
MRVRKLTFAILAATAALTLTACQDDGISTSTQGTPAAGQHSATPAASAKGSTPPATGGPAPAVTGRAKGAKCRTADLTVTAADRSISGDADRTVVVEFKNRSGDDCMISGYAGVDLKTSAGTVSAKRSGEPVVAGVLKSGKSTYFGISYPAGGTGGGSGVRITGLVVTPPDETQPVTLAWPGAAALPVTEGTDSPVKIGPVGSAGQGE